MQRIGLFIFLGIFFWSCQDITETTLFNEQYQEALLSNRNESDNIKVFLGFELGNSISDYEQRRDSLLRQDKLKAATEFDKSGKFTLMRKDTSDYFYPLYLSDHSILLKLKPTFKNDKLVDLELSNELKVKISDIEKIYEQLTRLYTEKYGTKYLEKINMYRPNDFYWIKDGKQIRLSIAFDVVQVNYSSIDYVRDNMSIRKEEKKEMKVSSPSLDDI